MTPAKIIYDLLVSLTIKETLYMTVSGMVSKHLFEAQDAVVESFGGYKYKDNPVLHALRLIDESGESFSIAADEWIDRMKLETIEEKK